MLCFLLWNKTSCPNSRGFTSSQKPIRDTKLAQKLITQLLQPEKITGKNNNSSKSSEACLESSQTSKIGPFEKIVNKELYPLTIYAKSTFPEAQ